jgi:uracil-DNA glycosylase
MSLFEQPADDQPPPRPPPKLEPSWLAVVGDEFDQPYMAQLRAFLVAEKQQYTVYPKGGDMFNAFHYTPFDQVRVVVLGQDPYHGPNQAHGLCFSVQHGIPPPPSLMNIFQELHSDLQLPPPAHGCLTRWAEQGVFLLNTCLSVRAGQAHSHSGKGWETFTDRVISELGRCRQDLVFMLWGRPAQAKMSLIDPSRHLVLTAPHPSPLSAHRGFFGCRHFSRANQHLEKLGQPPIDWRL